MSPSATRKMRKILTITRRMAAHLARPIVGTITGADIPEPVVALTFDDGPHPKFTPDLLDILQEHGARATFFVVGAAVRRYPHIVRRAAEAGHAIGNHTWDHPSFPFISRRERFRQVHACAGAIAPYDQGLFRPPGGHQSPNSRIDLLMLRQRVIGWNVDIRDYVDQDAQSLAALMAKRLDPGSIVLLHDCLYDRPDADLSATLEAVDSVLSHFASSVEFLTVPELLARGRPKKINSFWTPPENPYPHAGHAPLSPHFDRR